MVTLSNLLPCYLKKKNTSANNTQTVIYSLIEESLKKEIKNKKISIKLHTIWETVWEIEKWLTAHTRRMLLRKAGGRAKFGHAVIIASVSSYFRDRIKAVWMCMGACMACMCGGGGVVLVVWVCVRMHV